VRYPFVANLFNGPVPGLYGKFVASLRDKYGPIIGFKNLGANFVITQEPEITNELFLKNGHKANIKPEMTYLDVSAGTLFTKDNTPTGLASTHGEVWKDNRRFVMSTVFGADKIRKLDSKMLPELALFVNWLDAEVVGREASAVIDPVPYFQKMTLNVIGSIIADIRCNSLDGSAQDPDTAKFGENIVYLMDTVGGDFDLNRIVTMLVPASRSFERFQFPQFVRFVSHTLFISAYLVNLTRILASPAGLSRKFATFRNSSLYSGKETFKPTVFLRIQAY
jgi:hypothetical protein